MNTILLLSLLNISVWSMAIGSKLANKEKGFIFYASIFVVLFYIAKVMGI